MEHWLTLKVFQKILIEKNHQRRERREIEFIFKLSKLKEETGYLLLALFSTFMENFSTEF